MGTFLGCLLIAGLIGSIIGIFTTKEDRTSSVQVFIIIAMGSALITIVSINIFQVFNLSNLVDPTRLPAQLISALGFLGTGMMLFTQERGILGMNSAASLWITAILGMLVGAGLNNTCVIGTFFFVLVFWGTHFIKIEKFKKYKKSGE